MLIIWKTQCHYSLIPVALLDKTVAIFIKGCLRVISYIVKYTGIQFLNLIADSI